MGVKLNLLLCCRTEPSSQKVLQATDIAMLQFLSMRKSQTSSEYPTLAFSQASDWEHWLEDNHAVENGIWIKFSKKGSLVDSVRYAEALDVALCYGWIDGQVKGLDEKSYLQKFTPRRKNSLWSKRNVEHVARLITDGRMQPSGFAEIEAAKVDGRFDKAYDSPSEMQMPEDFLHLLKEYPIANAFFQTLNKTNLYSIAWRLQTASKPETRRKRMEAIIQKLDKRELFHP